jgi:hypothetical protein
LGPIWAKQHFVTCIKFLEANQPYRDVEIRHDRRVPHPPDAPPPGQKSLSPLTRSHTPGALPQGLGVLFFLRPGGRKR